MCLPSQDKHLRIRAYPAAPLPEQLRVATPFIENKGGSFVKLISHFY